MNTYLSVHCLDSTINILLLGLSQVSPSPHISTRKESFIKPKKSKTRVADSLTDCTARCSCADDIHRGPRLDEAGSLFRGIERYELQPHRGSLKSGHQ